MTVDRSMEELVVSEDVVLDTCGHPTLPEMGIIEQQWETDPISQTDIRNRAAEAVPNLDWTDIPDGGEVAIGAGSRGIANLGAIVAGVVDGVRDQGYSPFVVPAMGSHGGATAEGQREKLAGLGVDESTIGCEIRSSMEVVKIGETPDRGVPVYTDANAAAADALLPVNRVKPHTDFDGPVESGLSKMLVIGYGKQPGAKTAHDWSVDWSLRNMLPEITERLVESLPIVGGIAIVEDQRDETAIVEGIPPGGLLDREADLLERAHELMPTLPFGDLDALIVDEIGKDISGQGMDTNVTGRRHFTINEPEPTSPTIKRIYVRGLTDLTKGNAMGIGAADVVHRDVAESIDTSKSLINAITASTVRGVRLPPVVETDRAGVTAAMSTLGVTDPDEARLLRVTNTMDLERCYASPALLRAARERADLNVIEAASPIQFDNGALVQPSPVSSGH